jgi:uncharacterized membrane protein
MAKRPPLMHTAYLAAILIKGFDGAVETLLGLAIALAGPERLYGLVIRLTAPELADHPESRTIHAIRHGASTFADGGHRFVVFYLLVHGILKLGIVLSLLKGHGRWIYPLSVVILAGFVGYMSYRLSQEWSWWLLGFAAFDFLTILLVLNEWFNPSGKAAAKSN